MGGVLQPVFEHAFTITLTLGKVHWIRPSSTGQVRGGIYLSTGVVEGPKLNGKVIPDSGADWPLVRPNGVIDFDARYMLELDDGAIVYMQNRGFRWGSDEVMAAMMRREEVDPSSYYFRVCPKFETPEGPHEWLSRHIFVGVAEKTPTGNIIHYHQMM